MAQTYNVSFPITIDPQPPADDWLWLELVAIVLLGIGLSYGLHYVFPGSLFSLWQ